MKKFVLNIGYLLLTLFGVVSCNIKEDMSNCQGRMILDYSAYPEEILDDIAADEQIDIFIFDPDGICCDRRRFTYGELKANGLEFELPLIYRNYNAVVWQGLNSENYDCSSMRIGESYDNFLLKLLYDTSTLSYSHMPDPLWATPLEPIEYCAKITRHRVYMTRLHTQINVSVQSKRDNESYESLTTEEFHIAVNACNNTYRTDLNVCGSSIDIEYNEDCDYDGTSVVNLDYVETAGTLRITPNMACTLEVEGEDGSKVTLESKEYLDLVKYMLESKSDNSLTDQQFLDRNKVWDITVIVKKKQTEGYVAVGISINGWVRWFTSSELS